MFFHGLANAIVLNGFPLTIVGNNVDATGQAGEPNHAGFSDPLQSVWYSWTALTSGEFAIGGFDALFGGGGNDQISGGSQSDAIDGGSGNDTIYGNGGNDFILGGDGRDLIFGGSGNDGIDGGAGNDTIYGNGGDDLIDGGAGSDTIWLGTGAATVLLETGAGFDTINNFQLGQTTFRLLDGLTYDDLTFSNSRNGARISFGSNLLAVVNNTSASVFANDPSIFV
jgi:Ca2+-binding RTX toxin-like protein